MFPDVKLFLTVKYKNLFCANVREQRANLIIFSIYCLISNKTSCIKKPAVNGHTYLNKSATEIRKRFKIYMKQQILRFVLFPIYVLKIKKVQRHLAYDTYCESS